MDAAVERGGLGAVIACVRPTGEVPWAARPSEGPSRGGNAHLCERDGAGSEAARAAWPGTTRGPGRRRSQPRLATRRSRVAMFEKRACPYMGLHTTRANTHSPSLQFALVCPLPLFILYNYPPPYPGFPPPLVLITAGPCYGCRLQLLRFMLCVSYSSLPSIFPFSRLSSRHTPVRSRRSTYEPLLLENEREAVADLLQYLESESHPPPCPRASSVFAYDILITLRAYDS